MVQLHKLEELEARQGPCKHGDRTGPLVLEIVGLQADRNFLKKHQISLLEVLETGMAVETRSKRLCAQRPHGVAVQAACHITPACKRDSLESLQGGHRGCGSPEGGCTD